jgi:hypothetical protein
LEVAGSEIFCLVPEVNAETNMYMAIFRHENERENHNIKTTNNPFETVVKLKYFLERQ